MRIPCSDEQCALRPTHRRCRRPIKGNALVPHRRNRLSGTAPSEVNDPRRPCGCPCRTYSRTSCRVHFDKRFHELEEGHRRARRLMAATRTPSTSLLAQELTSGREIRRIANVGALLPSSRLRQQLNSALNLRPCRPGSQATCLGTEKGEDLESEAVQDTS